MIENKGVIELKKTKSILKRKKGSFSLEAVFAMAGILMITLLGISYFTYLIPRQMLTQEVHTLAQTAKIQGGLTDETSEPGKSDVERFKQRLSEKGFDPEKIIVEAVAENQLGEKRSVVGVEPLSEGYIPESESLYSHRNSKEVITVYVTIPAKKNFVNAMSRYWSGEDSALGDYKFSETIISERW